MIEAVRVWTWGGPYHNRLWSMPMDPEDPLDLLVIYRCCPDCEVGHMWPGHAIDGLDEDDIWTAQAYTLRVQPTGEPEIHAGGHLLYQCGTTPKQADQSERNRARGS